MSLPNTLWRDVQHLPINGFNPTPYRRHQHVWVIYRKKTGLYAQQLAPTITTPIGQPFPITPHLEDARCVPHTAPALITAACYNHPFRQILTFVHIDRDHARLLTNAHALHLDNAPATTRARPEKNWQPFIDRDRRLVIAYDAHPFTIATATPDPSTWHIAARTPWTLPAWAANFQRAPRMSTAPIALPDGRLIWCWHIKDRSGGYWTGANLSDPDYPYPPTHTTRQPLFTPDDADGESPHWPPNRCIFPMTAELDQSGRFSLWAGNSDRTAIVTHTNIADIIARMETLP
jgi:hypothetical protein